MYDTKHRLSALPPIYKNHLLRRKRHLQSRFYLDGHTALLNKYYNKVHATTQSTSVKSMHRLFTLDCHKCMRTVLLEIDFITLRSILPAIHLLISAHVANKKSSIAKESLFF